jgi:uncharacterized protein (DUF952 family)
MNVFQRVFHIAERDAWLLAQLEKQPYYPSGFSQDGFIHCCLIDQLDGVISRYFSSQTNLLVLEINSNLLGSKIKFENSEGGIELFPHLYDHITPESVVDQFTLITDNPGKFNLSILNS